MIENVNSTAVSVAWELWVDIWEKKYEKAVRKTKKGHLSGGPETYSSI